jgi:hypothetical protein
MEMSGDKKDKCKDKLVFRTTILRPKNNINRVLSHAPNTNLPTHLKRLLLHAFPYSHINRIRQLTLRSPPQPLQRGGKPRTLCASDAERAGITKMNA